jgi:hypothetical protein
MRTNFFLDLLQHRFLRRAQKLGYILSGITAAEYRVTGNQYLRSGTRNLRNGLKGNSSVNLDPEIRATGSARGREFPNLIERGRNELLPAKARIHRHY